jgi:hypothetical protein
VLDILSVLVFLLALYWKSILRKFLLVFSPMRFPKIKCCVPCDCVSLSDPICAIIFEKN